jgi:hypothetical protein
MTHTTTNNTHYMTHSIPNNAHYMTHSAANSTHYGNVLASCIYRHHDSAIVITTCYRLDGSVVEPRRGKYFLICSDRL